MIAIDALEKAMHDISARKGEFTLFALFKRSDAPGTWDLVVSAPWLEHGKLEALGELTELLAKSMGRRSLTQFSRVETVPSNNSTLKSILAKTPVEDGPVRVQNSDLFGLDLEEGIILRAKRPNLRKRVRAGAPTRQRSRSRTEYPARRSSARSVVARKKRSR